MTVPFLRQRDSSWHIVWPEYYEAARAWRGRLKDRFKIPPGKELHGVKLGKGRGAYRYGQHQFGPDESVSVFKGILGEINFLPDASIFTVVGQRGGLLYGEERLARVMNALFQRMRMQTVARKANGMVFFDQGHPEYRLAYRKAQKVLLTGSKIELGTTRNLPLDMFVKDGNEKNSALCHFTQIADLVAYAAFSRVKLERGMTDANDDGKLATLYSSLPLNVINTRVSGGNPPDGIVRL
ncbi:MAG: hypothetical protein WDM85_08590 [Caulobacteraceae bacterium]